jgi:hypothetical protein
MLTLSIAHWFAGVPYQHVRGMLSRPARPGQDMLAMFTLHWSGLPSWSSFWLAFGGVDTPVARTGLRWQRHAPCDATPMIGQ